MDDNKIIQKLFNIIREYDLFRNLRILVICILISGCDIFGPKLPIETLLSAPEQIEIDNRKYILETFLWRDFMPIAPPDGQPLISLIWVTAIDSLPFPSSIDATKLWVINEEEVCETKFSGEERPENPQRKHQLEKVARNGPKWGPGIYVDVVVRITYGSRNFYLLRASNQYISRTD